MKKLFCIVTALIMAFMLAACNGKPASGPDDGGNTDKQTAEATEAPTPAKDITLDDVMNAKVLPEEALFCASAGEGEGELIECTTDETVFALPETYNGAKITELHSYLFGSKSTVVGIRLPDSLRVITEHAFSLNENLQVVYAGSGLKTIEDNAFLRCKNLHTVILQEGVESIGELAFSSNTSLKSIEIPSSVTEIAGSAFFGNADDFTIIGTPGSYAEQYAAENGIPFQAK